MSHVHIAKRLSEFPEYIFAQLAKEVVKVEKGTGRKVLNFGPGTPDVRPSEIYLDQYATYIREPKSHFYPGYGAIPVFSDALITWYKKRFGATVVADEVLPLLGAKDGVSHIVLALANPGDEILMPNPGYPGYAGPTILFGAKPIFYDLTPEHDFKISLQSLEEKLSSKTAFIWINFPSNPTGQVATVEELMELVAFAKKHHVLLVYDNAYSEITFNGFVAPSILQVPGASEVAVEIGSFSKMSSFAGYRVGWIAGNAQVVAALGKVKSQLDSGLSLPLQQLAAYALTHPDKVWHDMMIASYQDRRDIIAAKLTKLGLTFSLPQGALYIWARIPESATDSTTYCMGLLREKQVLLTPGSAFGTQGERYVRVSICVNIETINDYL